MREIIRREVLTGELIPLAVFAGVVALVFILALINADGLGGASNAVGWTMQLVGALIAMVSAFGLFWRALNGQPLELQFGFVLALLAGLLLVYIHWSLAIALAAIGIALIVRQLLAGRAYPGAPASDGDDTADRPIP